MAFRLGRWAFFLLSLFTFHSFLTFVQCTPTYILNAGRMVSKRDLETPRPIEARGIPSDHYKDPQHDILEAIEVLHLRSGIRASEAGQPRPAKIGRQSGVQPALPPAENPAMSASVTTTPTATTAPPQDTDVSTHRYVTSYAIITTMLVVNDAEPSADSASILAATQSIQPSQSIEPTTLPSSAASISLPGTTMAIAPWGIIIVGSLYGMLLIVLAFTLYGRIMNRSSFRHQRQADTLGWEKLIEPPNSRFSVATITPLSNMVGPARLHDSLRQQIYARPYRDF